MKTTHVVISGMISLASVVTLALLLNQIYPTRATSSVMDGVAAVPVQAQAVNKREREAIHKREAHMRSAYLRNALSA